MYCWAYICCAWHDVWSRAGAKGVISSNFKGALPPRTKPLLLPVEGDAAHGRTKSWVDKLQPLQEDGVSLRRRFTVEPDMEKGNYHPGGASGDHHAGNLSRCCLSRRMMNRRAACLSTR